MADDTVIDDPGEFPEGFTDPVADPSIPWVLPFTEDDPFPADRLDDEPDWDGFEGADDNGQDDFLALELRGLPAKRLPEGLRGFVPSAVGGINLRDYSKNPQGKGWGAPCSGQRATVQLRNARVSVDVRIAELVGLIMRAIEARGYIFRAADTGAYNCRKISGSTSWSNHAWALAIDCNWQSNPYAAPLRTDIPDWARHLFNRYGFAWGGDYTGAKKDAMHFEYMGTPAQAQASLELARRELAGGVVNPAPAPAPAPARPPALPAWSLPRGHFYGDIKGPAKSHGGFNAAEARVVKIIQQRLIAAGCVPGITNWRSGWADGRWEGATTAAMATYQRRFLPRTTIFGQCWSDDYADLARRV